MVLSIAPVRVLCNQNYIMTRSSTFPDFMLYRGLYKLVQRYTFFHGGPECPFMPYRYDTLSAEYLYFSCFEIE